MATPIVVRTPSQPAASTLILAVKVLLVLVILLLLPQLVQGKPSRRKRSRRRQLELRALRKECTEDNSLCGSLIPEESLNCLYECMSELCYNQVYGEEPLEDGEIDFERYQEYERCLKDDLRNRRKEKRE